MPSETSQLQPGRSCQRVLSSNDERGRSLHVLSSNVKREGECEQPGRRPPSPSWQLPTRGSTHEVPVIADSDVYIGREFRDRRRRILAASKWRNPYKLRDHGDVHECIAKFDSNLLALMAELLELSGKRLLCHCRRGAPSHADAIIGAFAEFVMNAPHARCNVASRRVP